MSYVSYEENVYYNPENYDLETVGQVNWSEPNYSFDFTVVFRDSNGMFYWESDAGCSCPSPFESIPFEKLQRGSKFDVASYLTAKQADAEHEASEWDFMRANADYSAPQVVDLIGRVMK